MASGSVILFRAGPQEQELERVCDGFSNFLLPDKRTKTLLKAIETDPLIKGNQQLKT
jgi:hypothetical protein